MEYIGVDNHKKFSYLTLMDEKGKVLKEGRIRNQREALQRFLGPSEAKRKAVLEAGRNWTVMHDWLKEEVQEVKLAHPKKIKAIAEAKIKTDKIDAKILAHLLRTDLIPEAYVPSKETRATKNILRQRMFFVRLASMVKCRIHGIIDRNPQIKDSFDLKEVFDKQGMEWLKSIELSKVDRKLLNREVELLEYLNEEIKKSNSWVEQLFRKDKRAQLLETMPGIGKFFAVLIAVEIDNIRRFRNKDKLASYAGLIPSIHSSADKAFYGKLIGSGNKYLRWAFIEAVWPAIRKDLRLRALYQRIKARKNANIAKVAVARKLSAICYRVLLESRVYKVNYPGRPHFSLAVAN